MFDFGGELALQVQSAAPLVEAIGNVMAQGQETASRLEPVKSNEYRVQNQEIIGTMLSAASRFINWIIFGGIIISTAFVVWGFIKLNAASEDPRKRNGAILQIVLSMIAAAGCSLAFVMIGLGIELGGVLTGGAGVDVGSLGSGENTTANARPAGDLLGFYGEVAVVCNEHVDTTTVDGSGEAQWTWDASDEECTRSP
ncbi:MAG: hypothetical protein OXD31_00625 [Chloroflexi bacterium]|nr:hypothetical protein [Chloroflexota bacterium]